jgi:hypothetical protein
MRALAVVSGASRHEVDRTPGRLAAFLRSLAALGPVDLVVIHDEGVSLDRRRDWGAANLAAAPVEPFGEVVTGRLLEVAAAPPRRSGMVREVHLHRSDAPEREARQAAWFRVVDSFVASAPGAHDVVWCADLAALTRAGWIRRSLPAIVDVDDVEDLGSERARRAARRVACVAHLVTMASAARREQLALPGSIVAAPDEAAFAGALTDVVARAAAYRPARTS